MDLVTLLVVSAICLVLVVFLAGETTERALDTFGAGFLPYRGPGWPRGVQEGEPIPWQWAAMAERGVPPIDRDVPPDTGAEVFELDTAAEAELSGVEHGTISGGSSIRPS